MILCTCMRIYRLRRPCGMPCLKYRIFSEMKLRALELKLTKLKCTSNKGMEKHLLTLSACFANMKKAGQPYSDERKRFTLLNSLPDTSDWENMHHSGILKFDSYEKCVAAVELEVERLKERSMSKTQSSANFVQAKPKAKNGKPQGPVRGRLIKGEVRH